MCSSNSDPIIWGVGSAALELHRIHLPRSQFQQLEASLIWLQVSVSFQLQHIVFLRKIMEEIWYPAIRVSKPPIPFPLCKAAPRVALMCLPEWEQHRMQYYKQLCWEGKELSIWPSTRQGLLTNNIHSDDGGGDGGGDESRVRGCGTPGWLILPSQHSVWVQSGGFESRTSPHSSFCNCMQKTHLSVVV